MTQTHGSIRLGLPVGILGGGQLACMLGEAALRLGLDPAFLVSDPHAPAVKMFRDVTIASPSDEKGMREFIDRVHTVAFENEFVDCKFLGRAAHGLSTRFHPALQAIELLQDKLQQKDALNRAGIPTAPFIRLNSSQDPALSVREALKNFGGKCVLKWSRMGYDGKGVLVIGGAPEQATRFCQDAFARGSEIYAEQKIDFRRELAIIGCRSSDGDFTSYPLVISEQTRGICKRVYGPAIDLNVDAQLEAQARDHARKLAEITGLTGTFALEFFETREGELFVNEIAPRVHNSGHYTMHACATSQFENHWRAILGLPLGDTRTSPAFAMLNLLGPEGVSMPARNAPAPRIPSCANLQWYSKEEIRPGRKLGHINATGASTAELPKILAELETCDQDWMKELKK